MLNVTDSVAANIALQEEMQLQYEALIAEMNDAPKERRYEYIQCVSNHLRRLSEFTRSTAYDIRLGV